MVYENNSIHITKGIQADFQEQNHVAHDFWCSAVADADFGFCRYVRHEKDRFGRC
jgi:hypothetical protein